MFSKEFCEIFKEYLFFQNNSGGCAYPFIFQYSGKRSSNISPFSFELTKKYCEGCHVYIKFKAQYWSFRPSLFKTFEKMSTLLGLGLLGSKTSWNVHDVFSLYNHLQISILSEFYLFNLILSPWNNQKTIYFYFFIIQGVQKLINSLKFV